LELKQTNEKIE
jgi:hypothetical protein